MSEFLELNIDKDSRIKYLMKKNTEQKDEIAQLRGQLAKMKENKVRDSAVEGESEEGEQSDENIVGGPGSERLNWQKQMTLLYKDNKPLFLGGIGFLTSVVGLAGGYAYHKKNK